MYFQYDRQQNILQIDDTFARLISIDENDDLTFEFTYSINQLDAVKKKALTVNVTVLSKRIYAKPLFASSHLGFFDSKGLVSNILLQGQSTKTAVKEQGMYVVAFRSSDISAWINNSAVGQLGSNISAREIPSLSTTRLVTKSIEEIEQDNDPQPMLQFVGHNSISPDDIALLTSASIDLNTMQTMFKMILNQGLDPSSISNLTHRSIPALNSFEGLLRPSRAPELFWQPGTQLLNSYILGYYADPFRSVTSQVSDSSTVQVAETVIDDVIEVPINVTIPRIARVLNGENISHFLVKFDLIDNQTHVIVDTVTRTLDVARHAQLFYTPKKPPVVNVGSSDASHINLEIKQVDEGATSVQVYKKTLYRSIVEIEDYQLIGTFPLTTEQQTLMVSVEKPSSSTALYRVLPVGKLGTKGFDFTNVIAKPSRFFPMKATSVVAKITDSGIEVEVRHFPPSATSIQVLVRNLSIHEKNYRSVAGINLIDNTTRANGYLSVIDTNVSETCVYEYVARVIYENGATEISGNATLEFIKATPGKVDLQISNVEIANNVSDLNVTFDIRSTILDQNIDVVLALLRRQDIKEYFNEDITRERDFLKSLIAHNVQRVDLTSGQREDFGIVVDDFFDDRALGKNNAVSPLQFGKKYRYEVTTLLRAPETMFSEFVKSEVDSVTNKPYTFSPSKFLHPLALTEGIIVTSAGLRTRYSKEPMMHGKIGTTTSVEVAFDDQPARIIEPSTARFDRKLNVLTWKVEGSVDQIDHFLIIKDVHGVRTIVGRAHSEFEFGNCQYLHPITSRDTGELKYIIVPIFNDYKTGIPAITNSIIVN